MASLWNLNSVWVCAVLLVVATGCVLGDNNYNNNNNNAREHHNRGRPGSFCEDLSPQNFIEMDHVRTYTYMMCPCRAGGEGEAWTVIGKLLSRTSLYVGIAIVPVNWKCAMFVNKGSSRW